jgi:hypothetical protein
MAEPRNVCLRAVRDSGATGLQGTQTNFAFASAVFAAQRNPALRSFREGQSPRESAPERSRGGLL